MAGLTIGTLGFGKDAFYYGLELCLHRAGRKGYAVTPQTAAGCDVLLVTMFWFRDVYLLEAFLRKAGIHKGTGKPWILAGGMQATMTPQIISRMVDWVFIGDADDGLGPILDAIESGEQPESTHLYSEASGRVPQPAECSPSPFAMRKGGKRDVVRIEIARGCKYKCAFCALSNLKPYREVPFSALRPLLDDSAPAPCSLFAPERTMHSEWPQIVDYVEAQGRKDLGQDVRLEHMERIKGASVTIGVEGISRRLRKSIGKGYSQEFILDRLGKFVTSRNKIGFVSAYFIADLPGEDESDWDELRGLFKAIEAENWSRRLTLKPILNPLSPKSFTPLASATVHPFRDYRTKWQSVLRKGGHRQWGFRIVETMVWDSLDRVLDLIVERGGSPGYDMIRRMPGRLLTLRPATPERLPIARTLLTEARKITGSDLGAED
jgi:hypothetical protein